MTDDWVAPSVYRSEPAPGAGERVALERWLDYERATLLHKCAGLTSEQLKRRAVPPSRLSLLGLLRHMTDVERWWFRMHAAEDREIDVIFDPDWTGADFEAIEDADAEANLAAFVDECDASRWRPDRSTTWCPADTDRRTPTGTCGGYSST